MFDLDSFVANASTKKITLPLADAEVHYFPAFIDSSQADRLFETLKKETPWQQDPITIFGKTYPQPRLTALYGTNEETYTYSGITMKPHPFMPIHLDLLEKLQIVCDAPFTTVLMNLYRDGQDSNGWHSDDEKELGKNPVIASISLGAERVFHFKHKKRKEERYRLTLKHGSLLLMQGMTQHYWHHQLPKSKRIQKPRINLTFRRIEINP